MQTINKILDLLPNNWQQVLAQAHELERYLDESRDFIDDKQSSLEQHLDKLFEFLEINWTKSEQWLVGSRAYQTLDKVVLDIPALIAIPNDFDSSEPDQFQALIKNKMSMLEQALEPIEFKRLQIPKLRSLLEDIMFTAVNVPRDIDFDDLVAVNAYKNEVMDGLRPKLVALTLELSGFDISESNLALALDKFQSITDRLSEDKQESSPTSSGASNGEAEQAQSILQFIGTAKQAMPALKQEFKDKELAGIEAAIIFDVLDEVLTLVADNFEQVLARFTAVDWHELELEGAVEAITELVEFLLSIVESSPLYSLLQTILPTDKDSGNIEWPTVPVKLVGITNEQAFNQLKALLLAPENIGSWQNIGELDTVDLILLIKQRALEALDLLSHIAVFDVTAGRFIDSIVQHFDGFFQIPDDHDFTDLKANARLLLSKLLLIAELFFPEQNNAAHQSQKQQSAEKSEESQVSQTFAWGGQALFSLLITTVKKIQLIYNFLQEQQIRLKLTEQTTPAATNQRVVATEEQGSASSNDTSLSSTSSQSHNQGQSQESRYTASHNDSVSPDSHEQVELAAPLTTGELLVAALGDKESGLISKLENEADQDFVLGFISGHPLENFINTLKQWPEYEQLQSAISAGYKALQQALGVSESEAEPSSLATLISLVFSAIKHCYQALLILVKKLLNSAIEVSRYAIEVLYRLYQFLTLPTELLPSLLSDKLFPTVEYENNAGERVITDSSPNILCLVLALPVTTVKQLLNTPIETLEDWIEA